MGEMGIAICNKTWEIVILQLSFIYHICSQDPLTILSKDLLI